MYEQGSDDLPDANGITCECLAFQTPLVPASGNRPNAPVKKQRGLHWAAPAGHEVVGVGHLQQARGGFRNGVVSDARLKGHLSFSSLQVSVMPQISEVGNDQRGVR